MCHFIQSSTKPQHSSSFSNVCWWSPLHSANCRR